MLLAAKLIGNDCLFLLGFFLLEKRTLGNFRARDNSSELHLKCD